MKAHHILSGALLAAGHATVSASITATCILALMATPMAVYAAPVTAEDGQEQPGHAEGGLLDGETSFDATSEETELGQLSAPEKASVQSVPGDALFHTMQFLPGNYWPTSLVSRRHKHYYKLADPDSNTVNTVEALTGALASFEVLSEKQKERLKMTAFDRVFKSGQWELLRLSPLKEYIDTKPFHYLLRIFGCFYAAKFGRADVLEWLHGNDCFLTGLTCNYAAENGHLNVLQWLRAKNYAWDEQTCTSAAKNGHLEVLQWARANGCPWDEQTCEWAAKNGHLEVLQWAHSSGCPWDMNTSAAAAQGGQLAILEWLKNQGCPWDTWTCAGAAGCGHLAVLQWARARGCPWDTYTTKNAACNKHWGILKWAVDSGCPITDATRRKAAENNPDLWAEEGQQQAE